MEEIKGMTAEREMRILERAIEKFGTPAQVLKAIEELGELATELARDLNGLGSIDALREELADAFIMLNQLEMIYGDVSDVEIRKLERLERMVEDK